MSRHLVRGRQLSRDTEHRKALRRNLVQSLIEHGKIRTTLPKAREVRAMAEKVITLARTNSVLNRRRVTAMINDRRLVDAEQEFTGQRLIQKLFDDVAPQFVDRPGGYTRIVKLSDFRIGDGGNLVLLQLITEKSAPRGSARRSAGLRRKRNERKQSFATSLARKIKGEAAKTGVEQGAAGGANSGGANTGGSDSVASSHGPKGDPEVSGADVGVEVAQEEGAQ